MLYDVAIVGGGIVGCAIARELARYRLRIIVLEKGSDVASGTSKANSGIIPEPCPCGRTIRRMSRVGRRTDDMFIVRGVNVFPAQIEAALLRAERDLPHYQIILSRKAGLDQMEVQVEVTKELLGDTISQMESLQRRFAKAIEDVVGIRATVTLVEPQSIARSEGKAKRVLDTRKEDQI